MTKLFFILSIVLFIGISSTNFNEYEKVRTFQFETYSQNPKSELFEKKSHLVQDYSDGVIIEEEYSVKDINLPEYSFKKTIGFHSLTVNNKPRKKLYTKGFIIFEADNSPPNY
jgi:hypothetical protein